MKQLYNGSKQDEYLTPWYAVELINRYLKPNSTILCPFDKQNSEFVKVLIEEGHNVYWSHISGNKGCKSKFLLNLPLLKYDFFDYTKEDIKKLKIDYIISNPPFSLKTAVIEHLEKLNISFAMLMPISQMLETQTRQEIYKRVNLQVLHPNKRIKFINGLINKIEGSPTFTSGYLCRNILPKNLMFDNFKKN